MDSVCKNCEHSIFCPTWGEYKCVLHARKFITGLVNCKDYTARGKDFEDKPCKCETCLERGNEEDDM